MFQIRTDDYILVAMSAALVQGFLALYEFGEERRTFPLLLEPARGLWRKSKVQWLMKVLPLVLISIVSVWLTLRFVLPENEKQNTWILVAVCVLPLIINCARVVASQRKIKEHTDNALQLLSSAEEELKKLTEGPLIEDEELDRQILSLKKKVAEAREQLGIKNKDPNDR